MDLICADENRKDIDVLNSYELDMAFGKDENDFQLTVDRSNHCCKEGYYIYAEGEEYGGIVDDIGVDTENESITYEGRSWHGILENKVITPDPGEDYLILDGEANAVLQLIIDRTGLSDLFKASENDSGIYITGYQMDRYIYGYTGIKKMLKEFDAKLIVRFSYGKVVISAEPIYDYSQDEEFDTSQVDFKLKKKFRPVNHIICLGQGELKERAVIHIFTDEYGGIQQYLKDGVTVPLSDEDYILDESKKVMTGQDEVVEIYDVPNAEITTNYLKLDSKPADWEQNCEAYFYYEPKIEIIDDEEVDTGGSYKEASMVNIGYIMQKKQPYDWSENYSSYYYYDENTGKFKTVSGTTVYNLLTAKPGDWNVNYEEYFYKDGDSYKSVSGVNNTKYIKQTKKPTDWSKNYKEYYYFYSDGTTSEYRSVDGITWYSYDRQTRKPTDWNTEYGSYYRRATAKELKKNKNKKWYAVEKTSKNKAPVWKAKKYYTKHSHEKAPSWSAAIRYTRNDKVIPPAWQENKYYLKKNESAPEWVADKYYSETDKKIAPEWVPNKYFRQLHDRYAVMVAEAIEKLTEYHASDELSIDLQETEQNYDIGDIVGTAENITGLDAIQEVIKKIIKIKNDDIVISYEVG